MTGRSRFRRGSPITDLAVRLVPAGADWDPISELEAVGEERLRAGGLRVAVKPNLTWVEPRPGVTTTVPALESVTSALAAAGNTVSIVESDGGYGLFSADEAFDRHGIRDVGSRTGAEVVNLSRSRTVSVPAGGLRLDLPALLVEETDVIVSMPVPKVHVMTRFTGAVKNQWGMIPSDMRLRRHYRLPGILLDLLRVLPRQVVVMDGTFFLDGSGPLDGNPVRKDVMLFAAHPVAADAAALRLMGWDLSEIAYLRGIAAALGIDAGSIAGLPDRAPRRFEMRRTTWNWVALAGFRSRAVTYLGYESILAGPLHRMKAAVERRRGRAGEGGAHPGGAP